MSDSAPLTQQQNSSKMQAPDTTGRSTSQVVLQPQAVPAQPVVIEKVQPSVPTVSQTMSPLSQLANGTQPVPTPQPAPIATPASISPHKEAGPLPIAPVAEVAKPIEIVQPSTPEVTVPPEVKEVLKVSEAAKPVKIDAQLQKVGVTHAAESTPVVHTPNGDVRLPMTYADALATEKKTPFLSAVHWFAAFVAYQWRKLDPSLKD